MNKKAIIGKLLTGAALIASATLGSCIYDDQSECPAVTIRYTRNMKFADAAPHEVRSVKLYAYNADNRLVYTADADASALAKNDYAINLAGLPADATRIVTWGLGEVRKENSYTFGASDNLESLTCLVNNADGAVDGDLTPLFHAEVPASVARTQGVIDLTKDTNVIRVILQNISGEPIDKDAFRYEITSANGYLNYDNSLLGSQQLTYTPWNIYTGTAGVNAETKAATDDTPVSVVVAEFTVNRLVDGQRTQLTVYKKDTGDKVFSIPVNDYALLVKGHYNSSMTNQEYLDRQDEWNMTFFMQGSNWISSSIIINSWRVILSDVDI